MLLRLCIKKKGRRWQKRHHRVWSLLINWKVKNNLTTFTVDVCVSYYYYSDDGTREKKSCKAYTQKERREKKFSFFTWLSPFPQQQYNILSYCLLAITTATTSMSYEGISASKIAVYSNRNVFLSSLCRHRFQKKSFSNYNSFIIKKYKGKFITAQKSPKSRLSQWVDDVTLCCFVFLCSTTKTITFLINVFPHKVRPHSRFDILFMIIMKSVFFSLS